MSRQSRAGWRRFDWLARIEGVLLMSTIFASVACQPVAPGREPSDRDRVVELVEQGLLGTPGVNQEEVPLPQQYANLSDTGEIIVTRWNRSLKIVFFTSRGLVDAWEGYVFAADCHLEDDPLGGILQEVRYLGSCWYFARAH